MWCPHGNHMVSISKPHCVHMKTTCCLHANHVVYTWEPCGVYMVTTWCQHGNHMVSMWTPHGFYMDTMWFLCGHNIITTWFPGKHHWFPCGYHVVTMCTPCGFQVVTTMCQMLKPYDFHVKITLFLCGQNMVSIWTPCSFQVDTMWVFNLFQLISVRMANLICILGTESVQYPTGVEVDIIMEIVVFKKFNSVSEERGEKIQRIGNNFCCFFKKVKKGQQMSLCQ